MTTILQDADRTDRKGTLLLLTAAGLWSINGLLIKYLFGAGLDACTIASFRSLIAAVFLLPIALRRWKPIAEPFWVAAAVVFFTGMSASFVLATTLTTAANAIILQYTAPAWVFLLSPWIVGDHAERRQWFAFAVAMAAIGLIFFAQYKADAVGLSIGLTSGLVFGIQGVFFRRVRRMDPVVLAFLCCVGSGFLLLPFAYWFDSSTPSTSGVTVLAFMAVFQFGGPYVLYAAGVKYVSAQRAVLIIMLEPVLNPLWVFLFNGERPHWSTLAGGIMIVLSVASLALSQTNQKSRKNVGEEALGEENETEGGC